jgi:hypothetical protein
MDLILKCALAVLSKTEWQDSTVNDDAGGL